MKTNNSLIIIKKLIEDDMSKNEVEELFNIKAPTFYKHLELIKKAGFDINKKNKLYHIEKYAQYFNIEANETNLASYMLFLTFYLLPKKDYITFSNIMEKLYHFTSKQDYQKMQEKFEHIKEIFIDKNIQEKLKTLNICIKENLKAEIKPYNKKNEIITPLKIEKKSEKIYLLYLDKNKEQEKINLEKISKVSLLNWKSYSINKKEIIFELTGRLSTNYTLKEDERVIDKNEKKLVIANSSDNKKLLFKRLLRYDTLCKILFPKTEAAKFLELIKKSLDNINEFNDN